MRILFGKYGIKRNEFCALMANVSGLMHLFSLESCYILHELDCAKITLSSVFLLFKEFFLLLTNVFDVEIVSLMAILSIRCHP